MTCKDCFFYRITNTSIPDIRTGIPEVLTHNSCHRYPERYGPFSDYWCGEWKPLSYELDKNN